jgi:hypothetical protein
VKKKKEKKNPIVHFSQTPTRILVLVGRQVMRLSFVEFLGVSLQSLTFLFNAFGVSVSSFGGQWHSLWCSVAMPASSGNFSAAVVVFSCGFLSSLATSVVL